MKNESDLKMTDLDYLTAAPHLQMIKAALPYIHVPEQRFFSLMVKISELERTVRLFQEREDGMVGICSLEEDASTPLDMLNAMKPYGTPQEQEFIDLISNFLQGSRLYQSYRESAPETIPREGMSGAPAKNQEHQGRRNKPHGFQTSAQDKGSGTAKRSAAPEETPKTESMSPAGPGASEAAGVSAAPGAPGSEANGSGAAGLKTAGQARREGNRLPIEQLKSMLPPEQQSRLETAQLLMQTMQNFS